MELSERIKNILTAVVHRYITTAEPVSSAIIAEKYNLNLSTATIRHEMCLLEKYDYLWQPYTSSGRIPTDKGYRFYVDNLMVKNYLKEKEKRDIIRIYNKSKEFEETMRTTSQLLSRLTDNIGVVLAPVIYDDIVKNIQFVSVGNNRILTVIVTDAGLVCQKIINVSGEINRDRLKLLDELDKIISFQERFNYIHKFLEECFNAGYSENKVYLDGRINIVKHPEFKETDKLNYILSLIEEENILAATIRRYLGLRKTKIIIGKESKLKEMQNCSLVTSEYSIKGKPAGAIGILGPTRMDYPRMVSIAEYISDKLSEILSEF